jgi:hypothetical protein
MQFDATGGMDWDGFGKSGGFVFNEPPLETLQEEAQDKPARERGGLVLVPARGERSQEQEPLSEMDTFMETRVSDPVWTSPGPADPCVGVIDTGCQLLADPRALQPQTWRWCRGESGPK